MLPRTDGRFLIPATIDGHHVCPEMGEELVSGMSNSLNKKHGVLITDSPRGLALVTL